MLTWKSETYAATAADAAGEYVTRLWSPDGAIHDPGASRKLSKREDWLVHYAQVFVLATTSGYMKHGLVGQLILGIDYPGGWIPLAARNHNCFHPNYGLLYDGRPFVATHGVGWAFWKPALADTDKVILRLLYEPIARGPQ